MDRRFLPLAAVLLAAGYLAVGCGTAGRAGPAVPPDPDGAKAAADPGAHPSEGGLFLVSCRPVPAQVPLNQIHAWEVVVRTPDGAPVEGAAVTVDALMPAHGHGMPTRPQVSAGPGPGVYRVEGMKFQMPGYWIVMVHVDVGGEKDVASFALRL